MSTNWFTSWHGAAQIPGASVSGGAPGGGSTAMSTGVTNALSTKASLGHTHPQSDITNLASTLAALSAQISTKAAGAHTHPQSEITGLESSLSGLAAQISTKAAGTHTHAQSEITGLESTIANLAAQISTKAAGTHTHAQADVTNLTSTLAAISAAVSTKAAGAHAHAQADVTDLTSTLAAISASVSTKAAGSHTHVMADISNLRTGIPSTWATCSTHILTGSTAMQSITGLSFAISSASMYRFEFVGGWQSISSATGIALGVNGPASPTLLAWEWGASTGVDGVLSKSGRAFGVQTIAVPQSSVANVDMYFYLGGVVRTGANAGTLQAQFASEVAGSTASIRAGSVGFLFGPL